MIRALSYLGTLPGATTVYPGHEYTAGNVAFAISVDPSNEAIGRLAELVKANPISTARTTIGEEKGWNLFMRLHTDAVRNATSATAETPDSTVMNALRKLKNNFRG